MQTNLKEFVGMVGDLLVQAAYAMPRVDDCVMRLAKEFVESPDIHEPIADNGITVADGYQEAFRHALGAANE